MNFHVMLIDKETHNTIKEKSLHFEQAIPTKYVLACYMDPLFGMSGDPNNYVRINRDGITWEQDTLC